MIKTETQNLEDQVFERLEQLVLLSGWDGALEALDAVLRVDAFLQSGGTRQ